MRYTLRVVNHTTRSVMSSPKTFAIAIGSLALFLIAAGKIGAENARLLAECKPVHGVAECELRILGR
jgi:hypothetical protein